MPTLATQPRVIWQDATARHWGGMRNCHAVDATFGPVTLTVYRNAFGRWGCRCQLWASRDLGPIGEQAAKETALKLLRDAVGRVEAAIEGKEGGSC